MMLDKCGGVTYDNVICHGIKAYVRLMKVVEKVQVYPSFERFQTLEQGQRLIQALRLAASKFVSPGPRNSFPRARRIYVFSSGSSMLGSFDHRDR